MATYRLESRTRAGAYLATLPFRNIQGEFFLNKPNQIRWDQPLHPPVQLTEATFYPGITEAWLYRNNVLIYAGPLWEADASTKDEKISCTSEDVSSYFQVRRISADVKYTASRDMVAWDLISASQAMTDGNLFITQGTIGGAPGITIPYARKEGIYLNDAIDDLADGDSGFDWEVTPTRVFNTYYPRITGAARVRLDYPGGNLSSYAIQVMGKYEANDILIRGPDTSVSAPAIDTTKRAQYGLRQYTGSGTTLKTQSLLDDFAALTLQQRRDARRMPQVTARSDYVNPFDGDITYGQLTQVRIDDGWVQYDEQMRLSGFQVTVGKGGEETFVLYLNDLREVS